MLTRWFTSRWRTSRLLLHFRRVIQRLCHQNCTPSLMVASHFPPSLAASNSLTLPYALHYLGVEDAGLIGKLRNEIRAALGVTQKDALEYTPHVSIGGNIPQETFLAFKRDSVSLARFEIMVNSFSLMSNESGEGWQTVRDFALLG